MAKLYPSRVALLLIASSLTLYLFFTLIPIVYSIYIAFTDANAVNVASEPKIRELQTIRREMERLLRENREFVIRGVNETISLIHELAEELKSLRTYVEGVTVSNFSRSMLASYKSSISRQLASLLSLVKSNRTFLYYYGDLRLSLDTASRTISYMWSEYDRIMGFKFLLTEDDVNRLRNATLPRVESVLARLNESLGYLEVVTEDYELYISKALKSVNYEIDRLSLHFVGLRNFEILFTDSRFPYSVLKTLLFVITSVPLKVSVGVSLAFLFSSPNIYGRRVMRTLLLTPWALPVLLSVTTWKILFSPGSGPLSLFASSALGRPFSIYTNEWDAFIVYNVVEMWLAYPFIMTVTMGAISGVPKELIEAAYVDGSGRLRAFRDIMLPLTLRPILFATIMTSGASLQAFMVPLLLNGGGPATRIHLPGLRPSLGNANELMVLFGYNRAWLEQDYGLSTASYLVVVGILFIYAAAWFYMVYRGDKG